MTRDLVENSQVSEPEAIISEATNMIGATISSETEVENKLNSIVSNAGGVVLAEFAFPDVHRLNSFYYIAKQNDRCLAVKLKQAQLLNALSKDPHLKVPGLDEDHVLIFRKTKKRFEKWEHDLRDQYSGRNTVFDAFEA